MADDLPAIRVKVKGLLDAAKRDVRVLEAAYKALDGNPNERRKTTTRRS